MYVMIAIITSVKSLKPIAIKVISTSSYKSETVLIEDLYRLNGKIENIRMLGKKVICKDIASYPLIELKDEDDYIDIDVEFNTDSYEDIRSINSIDNKDRLIKIGSSEYGVIAAKCDGSLHIFTIKEAEKIDFLNTEFEEEIQNKDFIEDLKCLNKIRRQELKLRTLGKSLSDQYDYDKVKCWSVKEKGDIRQFYFSIIGFKAFVESCITSIDATSVRIIEPFAFYECYRLKKINLGNNLKEIASATFKHSGIEELIIPESVEKIGKDLCESCSNLVRVEIKSEHIEEIESRFALSCGSLKEIKLSNSIKNIGYSAFSGCNITLGDEDLKNIEQVGPYAFYGNKNLNFGSLNFDKIDYIGTNAFSDCGLNDIEIKSEFVSMGASAFSDSKLNNFKANRLNMKMYAFHSSSIRSFEASEVQCENGIFIMCPLLKEVKIKNLAKYEVPLINLCGELEYIEIGFGCGFDTSYNKHRLIENAKKLKHIKILGTTEIWDDRFFDKLIALVDGQEVKVEFVEQNRIVTLSKRMDTK